MDGTLLFFSYINIISIVAGILSGPAFKGAVEIGQVAVTEFSGNLLGRAGCRLQQFDGFLLPDVGDKRFIGCLFIGQMAP